MKKPLAKVTPKRMYVKLIGRSRVKVTITTTDGTKWGAIRSLRPSRSATGELRTA